jgi:hypothetical protein
MQKAYWISAAFACALVPSGTFADGHSTQTGPRIYPFHSAENHCPTGLQPITINGVICCGTPNQKMTYQQALAHPAPKRHVRRVARRADCPIGTKGCTYD